MPFIPAPNIVQVELRATLDNQKIENRWNFDALTAPTEAIVTALGDMVAIWAGDEYAPLLPNAIAFTQVVATDMSVADGFQYSRGFGTPIIGGQASPPMPNEVTFCVSLRTGRRGRSARGRDIRIGAALCSRYGQSHQRDASRSVRRRYRGLERSGC